jgi:CheY-like chemotaxis protein
MIDTQEPFSLHILLADDDKDDRLFFEKAVGQILITTQLTTVHDGEQLMQYLSNNAENLPSILFLDLNMPRKNGFECLLEIKENILLKDIYVIMFSTSYPRDVIYEQDMINRLYRIGAQDYIRKPSDFTELKRVIEQAIRRALEKKAISGHIKMV